MLMNSPKALAMDGTLSPLESRSKNRLRRLNLPLLLLVPCMLTFLLCLSAVSFQSHSPGPRPPKSSPVPQVIRGGQPEIPVCPHILLFTAPRHGSTWLIDSAERCRYSNSSAKFGERTYSRDTNPNSELWNKPQNGPLRNISAQGAAEYLHKNGSIKIFPVVVSKYADGLKQIVEIVKNRLPVIVLTRRLDHAHGSLVTAMESKAWNILSNRGTVGEERGADEDDPHYKAYRRRIGNFFEEVRRILNESDVHMVDEFDYDDVKSQEFIEARSSGCYIHNCNFKTDEPHSEY